MATTIQDQHAASLAAMVRWFKTMIVERDMGTPELTAEYCDELIEDLTKENQKNETGKD